jgi:transposase
VKKGITFVGMDAHKKAINVAMLLPGSRSPVEWVVVNEPAAVKRLVRKIRREAPGEVRTCYEAGPLGYSLQRQIVSDKSAGLVCEVIAPSLIPVKPGERVKTDRRDARKLAFCLRNGDLTEVHPPTEAEEAVRDLTRCREDAKEDLMSARHRLSKWLLRRGLVHGVTKKAWTQAHRRWLRGLTFDHEADQAVFDDYLLGVEHLEERILTLDTKVSSLAQQDPYREPVGWLRCFRGIDVVTAMTLVAELHDFRRFESPRQMMAYLGLTPRVHQSSDKCRLGSITKAGNSHARRVLVETSWHYRHQPGVGKALRLRRQGQPARVIALADKAQQRLNRRYRRLTERGKPVNKAIVAVARELVGFVWAALHGYEKVVA